MKYFLKKILFFTCLFSIVLVGTLYLGHRSQGRDKIEVSPQKHILVIGDSNTECAINDSICKSFINLSSSACPYFYSYVKLKKVVADNPHIDTILLSFAPHNIFDNNWLIRNESFSIRFSTYFSVFDFNDIKYLISLKPYSSLKATSAILLNILTIAWDTEKLKWRFGGYYYLDKDILNEVREKLKKNQPIPFFHMPENLTPTQSEINYLNRIRIFCATHHIKLILINTPKRNELINYSNYGTSEFYKFYTQYYSDTEFLDLSRLKLDEKFHADFVHLNYKGAKYFSTLINEKGLIYFCNKYSLGFKQKKTRAK